MSSGDSISRWIDGLKAGNAAAAQKLWEQYFQRLTAVARARLGASPRRARDEEDLALSAFDTLCRHAVAGRFADIRDRDSLWRLLVVITLRKTAHWLRAERQQKRGGLHSAPEAEHDLEDVLSREPTPQFAAQCAEEHERLLALLVDGELKSVALLKMEGYTVDEIAEKLGYVPRSIKRKLQVIRNAWEREMAP
jgi:DNA-directed RNA polymerase specialized sigma24 family protein